MKQIRKHNSILLLALIFLLLLSGCGGKVRGAVFTEVPSEIFGEKEIQDAISVVVQDFALAWSGCTLTEIGYAGDAATQRITEEYLSQKHAAYSQAWGEFDQAIVLISSFDVDSSGADGSFKPNTTYSGWHWILVRNNTGAWRHVDHGYG